MRPEPPATCRTNRCSVTSHCCIHVHDLLSKSVSSFDFPLKVAMTYIWLLAVCLPFVAPAASRTPSLLYNDP